MKKIIEKLKQVGCVEVLSYINKNKVYYVFMDKDGGFIHSDEFIQNTEEGNSFIEFLQFAIEIGINCNIDDLLQREEDYELILALESKLENKDNIAKQDVDDFISDYESSHKPIDKKIKKLIKQKYLQEEVGLPKVSNHPYIDAFLIMIAIELILQNVWMVLEIYAYGQVRSSGVDTIMMMLFTPFVYVASLAIVAERQRKAIRKQVNNSDIE